jgi:hypothetical protein
MLQLRHIDSDFPLQGQHQILTTRFGRYAGLRTANSQYRGGEAQPANERRYPLMFTLCAATVLSLSLWAAILWAFGVF